MLSQRKSNILKVVSEISHNNENVLKEAEKKKFGSIKFGNILMR